VPTTRCVTEHAHVSVAVGINVLDFGGACGAHYFLARAVMPSSRRLKWLVVETPEMAQRAKDVFSSDELEFSSSLSDAADSIKRIDLLHTSGTLQSVDKPYDYLRILLSASASHILFNRLALTGVIAPFPKLAPWIICVSVGVSPI
jgi:putative methyltransferase (TIGR04325 family)